MTRTTDESNTESMTCGQAAEPSNARDRNSDGLRVMVRPVSGAAYRRVSWEASIFMDTPEWAMDGDIAIGLGGVIGATPIDALSRLAAIITQEATYSFSDETAARATDAISSAISDWSRSPLIEDDINDYFFLVVADDGRVLRWDRRFNERSDTGMRATPQGLVTPWRQADELNEFFRIVSDADPHVRA